MRVVSKRSSELGVSLVHWFDSPAEFARAADAGSHERHGDSAWGGGTWEEAVRWAVRGKTDLVPAAEALLGKIGSEVDAPSREWVPARAGSFPSDYYLQGDSAIAEADEQHLSRLQWSPGDAARWSRENPVNAAELERLAAEDAQKGISAAPTVTALRSLRDRLITLHGLETDASDDEIFAAADDIYRRWSMEFS